MSENSGEARRSSAKRLSGAERFARAFDDRSAGLDRFGLVLVLTVFSVVGLALVDIHGDENSNLQKAGALLAATVVGLTLVTALRASGLSRRRQRLIDLLVLLVVVGYVASLLGTRTPDGVANPGVSAVLVLLSVAAPIVVVLRLVRHRRITSATIMGAISAYLLIAVSYFYLFLAVGRSSIGFFGTPQASTSYMYFSLTTITTVGYGDLTAVTKVGRLLATSEAVIGQVYLVTFVAFIVSLGASSWRERLDAIDADESESDSG